MDHMQKTENTSVEGKLALNWWNYFWTVKAICPEGLAPRKEERLDLNNLLLGYLSTQALIQKPSCTVVLYSISDCRAKPECYWQPGIRGVHQENKEEEKELFRNN